MAGLIVRSKIKETVSDVNVAGDVAEALDKEVEAILQKAATRAKANGRRTLQARDL